MRRRGVDHEAHHSVRPTGRCGSPTSAATASCAARRPARGCDRARRQRDPRRSRRTRPAACGSRRRATSGTSTRAAKVTTLGVPPEVDERDRCRRRLRTGAPRSRRAVAALAAPAPGGPLTFARAPVPARLVGVRPGRGAVGREWPRLVHVVPQRAGRSATTVAPACIIPAARSVSLARVRRGLRIAVREPARITVFALYGSTSRTPYTSDIRSARGRLPAATGRFASGCGRIARELAGRS